MLDLVFQLDYIWNMESKKMPILRITKTLSLDRNVAQAIEKIAKQEHRSFTKQVEVMLEQAYERFSKAKPPAGGAA